MSNNVASDTAPGRGLDPAPGIGIYTWPGRAMLPGSQLSNAELWKLSLDQNVHPTSRKAARKVYSTRVAYKRIRIQNRIAARISL